MKRRDAERLLLTLAAAALLAAAGGGAAVASENPAETEIVSEADTEAETEAETEDETEGEINEAPDMPEGMTEGEMGEAPALPEGMTEGEMGERPEMPDGEGGPGGSGGGGNGGPGGMGGPGGDGDGGNGGPDGKGGPGGDGERPEMPDGDGGPGGSGEGGMGGPGGGSDSSSNASVLGSWSLGGTDADSEGGDDYAYDAALYVTADGIDEEKSAQDRISGGTCDASGADGITISDSTSGHNGILVTDADFTLSNALIELLTDADGSDTCDFSGKGTAVAIFGEDAHVTVEDSTLHTAGVATMPLFADDGATVTVKNCVMQSDGGTLNAAYMNTPDQTLMVAPPWILGIMGTSRCSNMMGTDTTTNVIDSETSAGAWAVLSTDAGTDMYLNVYNTTLTLNNADESQYLLQEEGGEISETLDNPYTVSYGSGYGTYAIGNAVETFAGARLYVGTYATIFTGGSAVFTSLEEGNEYELKNSAGETTATYTATESLVSEIHSDTFGFMAHQSTNSLTLEKGTVVESAYATFLVKSGSSSEQITVTADDTLITNGGVLIQVMDNDDATNGGMMATDDEANTNGGSQNFIPYHTEENGFSTDAAEADSTVQRFTFTNGTYSGNIYNASGSDGLSATTLEVALGEGAVLDGAAASTSAVHITYEGSQALLETGCLALETDEEAAAFCGQYQNTEFTINEYFSIGHVANRLYDNGGNAVNITLSADAVWNVTATSLITSLTIEDDATVVVPEGVTLTVGGTEYTGCTLGAGDI